MTSARVVIVGAGLHGCSAALHLARAGHRVTVLEKDYAGRHASGVNAGGVRRLGRHPAEIPLSLAAWHRWQRISEIVGDDCGFVPSGHIQVAESEADMETLEKRCELVRSLGFDHEYLIDAQELRRRVPAINPDCVGALVCDGDGFANPYQTVTAWRRRAQAEGVTFREGFRVDGIRRKSGVWHVSGANDVICGDILVNCTGAWAGEMCRLLGESVPISAEAPMLMISERVKHFLEPVIGATHRPLSFKQFPNGTVLIGGGVRGNVDAISGTAHPKLPGLADNAATVTALFPFMDDVRIVRIWAGMEGVMPDDVPVIGFSSIDSTVIHAFGFSAHGFQLSPVTGEIVRDLVEQRLPVLPIAPFDICRFTKQSTPACAEAGTCG